MLERFLKLLDLGVVKAFFTRVDKWPSNESRAAGKLPRLNAGEIYVVRFLVFTLGLIEETSRALSGCQYPSFMLIAPLIQRLKSFCSVDDPFTTTGHFGDDFQTETNFNYEPALQVCKAASDRLAEELRNRFDESSFDHLMKWAPLFHPLVGDIYYEEHIESVKDMKIDICKLLHKLHIEGDGYSAPKDNPGEFVLKGVKQKKVTLRLQV